MGIFNRGNSKQAFAGELSCPVCHKKRIRYVENVGPYRLRYQCKDCGMTFQYDISNRVAHPYSVFKKNKFIELVNRSKRK
jgi:transposase-like protein